MFSSVISKHFFPISYRILQSTAPVVKKPNVNNLQCKNVPKISHTLCRFYAKEPKLEDMVVNFQDVKKATSNEKVLIVDVREPEEIKEHGKIPNSINIPLGTVSSTLGVMSDAEFEKIYKRPKPTEDTEIIFYCMIGKRSGMAQQNAFNLGYKNVKNYLGSWTDWANKN